MEKQQNKIVNKSWGYELWFVNNEYYGGKYLYISQGQWSSGGKYHYHKVKDETFFVINGTLILDLYNDEWKVFERIQLYPRQAIRIKPGTKHRFSTNSQLGCEFIEVSTPYSDEDSYRCFYDENKKEWIED